MRRIRKTALCALGLALAQMALADAARGEIAPAPAAARRFTIADFAQFSPVNALDAVKRIPGFSIERIDEQRGFGGNAGNVLIDGDRPSTKTDSIETLLSRIPAAQIDYIELIEAAGGDAEARGKSQIVNVVRKASAQVTGTYALRATMGERHDAIPHGEVSASFRRGASTFDVNASYFSEHMRGRGPEDFEDGRRALIERRTYRGHGGFEELELGAAMKTTAGAARINANAKLSFEDGFDDRLGFITAPGGAAIGLETLLSRGPDWDMTWELGGDAEFPLAERLSTKIIGLWRSGEETAFNTVDTVRVNAPATGFIAQSRQRPDEGIVRIQNDWAAGKAHAIQFGGEMAYNRLRARLTQQSRVGGATLPLPASNVLVRELRFEPFVSDVWSIGRDWKLEAGLVFETSTLRLTGDSNARRRLSFWKPRAIATWTPDKATSLEFRAQRTVAQLDFAEFATAVDLSTGNQVDAGNADLVPEQMWRIAALVRRKFMERGSIQLNVEREWLNDTQDLVPIFVRDANGNVTGIFDGAGNIGKSSRWNVEVETTLPLDWLTQPIGVTGMEVKYVGHYHPSRVTDPVTGARRRARLRPLWHAQWDFRHDVGQTGFAWGASVTARGTVRDYFFDQVRVFRETPNIGLFAEYAKFRLGTIRLDIYDASSYRWYRDRFFFSGTRASGNVTDIIERVRRLDTRFQLSLTGKF